MKQPYEYLEDIQNALTQQRKANEAVIEAKFAVQDAKFALTDYLINNEPQIVEKIMSKVPIKTLISIINRQS